MVLEYRINSKYSFEEACSRVPEAVSKNGFAVLAEIKTSEILQSKGFDYAPLRTYDICNAGYANKALSMSKMAEALLPCHLIVKGIGDHTEISVQLPRDTFNTLFPKGEVSMETFLNEVEGKLKNIADSLAK